MNMNIIYLQLCWINKMQYEATYVNLRDSIDVVVAGELNQYYLGNYDNFN